MCTRGHQGKIHRISERFVLHLRAFFGNGCFFITLMPACPRHRSVKFPPLHLPLLCVSHCSPSHHDARLVPLAFSLPFVFFFLSSHPLYSLAHCVHRLSPSPIGLPCTAPGGEEPRAFLGLYASTLVLWSTLGGTFPPKSH